MSVAWDPNADIDWSGADKDARRRASSRVPFFDFLTESPRWRRLTPARRAAFRLEAFDWTVCQLIHGEDLALETARAVASSRAPSAVRADAALLAVEEARHRRVFALYRSRVLGRRPASLYEDWCPALRRLLRAQPRWDLKLLALQVVGERVFLGRLQRLRRARPGPVFQDILRRVIRDERRHCARGLEPHLARPRGARARRERADFAFQVGRAMIGEFPADVFSRSGLDPDGAYADYRESARRGRAPSGFERLGGSLRELGGRSASARLKFAALELV